MKYEPIPGQAHNPSEEETMSVIRSVLTEAEEPAPRRRAHRAGRKAAAVEGVSEDGSVAQKSRAFVERTAQPNLHRRADDLPELHVAEDGADNVKTGRSFRMPKIGAAFSGFLAPVFAKLRGFRPSTRHIALLSMALLVVLRPHWFVISGILAVALFVATFLILGSDRIWRMVVAWLNHVEARNPARAARLRTRLDGFACRWDAILDLFPDGMVDSLYMPDLQAMQDADAAHNAAVETRLNQMAHDS